MAQRKILYVEDNKFDLLAFERFMKEVPDIDYSIVTTIQKAQEALARYKPDIIVSDFSLSDGTAFDILEIEKDIPVIVTTGTGNEEIAVKLMRGGARDYLIKDVDNNYLKILPLVIENTLAHIEDQRALIKSQIELEQAREIQNKKDEFIGIASHELKTPLTSVKAYIQLMAREMVKKDQIDARALTTFVSKTEGYVNKLEHLINNLLDVSKLQAGKMEYNFEPIRLDHMIADVVEGARHLFPNYEFILDSEQELRIIGDKIRLEQVLVNYLTNAVKYSPNGNQVLVRVAVKDSEAIVHVQDFGIGISKESQARIFDRYFRVIDTNHRFSGLGVGLYISHEIIDRHNGKVWVESEEGKGSTFYFSVPLI